jgi:uncharacterized protein (DUF2267 family)
MIPFDTFLGQVMRASRLDAKAAHRATFATIRALAEVLDEPIATAFRSTLPHKMALMILSNAPHRRPADFYSRVATHEGRSLDTSKEHAEMVCRVLGATLEHDLVERMGKDLHHPELFEVPSWHEAHASH